MAIHFLKVPKFRGDIGRHYSTSRIVQIKNHCLQYSPLYKGVDLTLRHWVKRQK